MRPGVRWSDLIGLGAAVGLASSVCAQFAHELAPRGEVALRQALLDARSDQLALLVATHPDDQYLHPAALLRFHHGWRVAVALVTRGEGGQNISGSETGDALAQRRTYETAMCAARLGIEVHFLDRPDTGFCRDADEALDSWGRVPTTDELALLIRHLRPDVVWTTHHPGEDHGHDQALLRLLPDAVQWAASDKRRYGDLSPWQVRAVARGCSPAESATLELPGDGVDPVRGETYRLLAYRALAEHRSQAPFRAMDELFPALMRLRSALPDDDAAPRVFDVDQDLFSELAALGVSSTDLAVLREALERALPSAVADRAVLVGGALHLRRLLLGHLERGGEPLRQRVSRRLQALDAVIVHGLGFVVRVDVGGDGVATTGAQIDLDVRLDVDDVFPIDRVTLRSLRGGGFVAPEPIDLGALRPGATLARRLQCQLDPTVDPRRIDLGEPALELAADLDLADQRIVCSIPAPVELRPTIEVEATRPLLLWPRSRRSMPIAVRIRNHEDAAARGTLEARAQVGWSVTPSDDAIEIAAGGSRVFTLMLTASEEPRPTVHPLLVRFQDGVAEIAVHVVDVSVPENLQVGLIPGVDDTSRRVLEDLGVKLHVLDNDDVATFPLETLHTVLVDMRALRVQETARAAFDRLLQFARGGGRLVVLYHKDKEWDWPGFRGSPYPLRIGRERVTRQDAPVRVLREGHALLRWPNRLQARDWDGWVQERGLYFATEYDARYEELLGMADPGEPELRGGLLYAQSESGDYVYCALALFRQLKNLHPGACRLFANLVTPSRAVTRR